MNKTSTEIVLATRQTANVVYHPIVTDEEVCSRNSEGLSDLFDKLCASNEHYAVESFTFTIADNSNDPSVTQVLLPTDFFKEVSVDWVQPNGYRQSVFPMSYSERNRLSARRYVLLGNYLRIGPSTNAAGTYVLQYTPLPPTLALPSSVSVNTGTVLPPFVADNVSGGYSIPVLNIDVVLVGGNWHFSSAAFTNDMIGAKLVTSGFADPENNGTHTVLSLNSATDLVTDGITANDFALTGLEVATLTTSPTQRALWVVKEAGLTADNEGLSVVVSGSTWSDNNDTFVIDEVVNEYSFYTAEGSLILDQNLTADMTLAFQIPGTIIELPQIYMPSYQYIRDYGYKAILQKREQDTSTLDARINAVVERIRSSAANRKEEGGQVPLTRGTGDFWDCGPWGVIGPGGA